MLEACSSGLRAVPKWMLAACAAALLAAGGDGQAQVGDELIVQAREMREALKKKDKPKPGERAPATGELRDLRDRSSAARHPLASWVDYWELSTRLPDAQQNELDAFYARWPGTYVEDRLRNDWLLELGRRRDWANFAVEFPRFRMNDDREVSCYALLTQHLAGQDVKGPALAAWYAQRDADDGCTLLAGTLFDAGRINAADVWLELRYSIDANRPRAARAAAALLGPDAAQAVSELLDQPARWLDRRPSEAVALRNELATLALMRLAANDPDDTAARLAKTWGARLSAEQAGFGWASAGRVAAFRLSDRAHEYYAQAWTRQRLGSSPRWSDEMLAWSARAALRGHKLPAERWQLVLRAIDAMSPQEARDPAWAYWKARAHAARARHAADRDDAQRDFETAAAASGGLGFYPMLAAQQLGRAPVLPAPPPPLTDAERERAASTPGLKRGLQLAQLGLRDEGRREWNFTLRGMADRDLLAAAQLACEQQDWQLCINTSERTREQIDLRQRYPMPFAEQVRERALERELDPAFVFGLIRQESRFMVALRSSAGAAGLMQLMPATARWTARKIGMADFKPERITDPDTNLRLGTMYLKLVLDDFAGAQALAAAAYNAGPSRPRRWREGPALDAAAWTENIPFNETRDYVKKVLSNAMVYSRLLGASALPLTTRLGTTIGPRDAAAAPPDTNLP